MDTTIFDKLIKIKDGTRAKGYDIQNHIPAWNESFDTLFGNLSVRKQLLEDVKSLYTRSAEPCTELNAFLEECFSVFTRTSSIKWIDIESVVAQEMLVLIYGIKICAKLYSSVKTEEEALTFFKLFQHLYGMTYGFQETLKVKKDSYWHRYGFRIGMFWLAFVYTAQDNPVDMLPVKLGDTVLRMKGRGGYGTNPVHMILSTVLPKGTDNQFVNDKLRDEIYGLTGYVPNEFES